MDGARNSARGGAFIHVRAQGRLLTPRLRAQVYNEKIDVFSYAMCLVELVDCKLPWSGVAMGAEVPHRVTTAARPERLRWIWA